MRTEQVQLQFQDQLQIQDQLQDRFQVKPQSVGRASFALPFPLSFALALALFFAFTACAHTPTTAATFRGKKVQATEVLGGPVQSAPPPSTIPDCPGTYIFLCAKGDPVCHVTAAGCRSCTCGNPNTPESPQTGDRGF